MRLSPGTRIGNYEVVAAVGAGGMGEVYRARSRRLLFGRQGRLFIVDIPSGNVREIFAIPGEGVIAPRLSPDGKTIYFLRGSSSGDIWTARFDAQP